MVVGYCLKCKAKSEIKDAKFELNAKGRPIARGKCGKCQTTMYKILSAEEAAKAGIKAKAKGKGEGSHKSRKSHKSGGGSRKSKASKKSRKGSRKSKASKKSRKSRK